MYDYPIDPIEAPNPALDGPFAYRTYFYGSGDDKRRKEYSEGIDFETEPVDANPFVGFFDQMPRYWGFDFDRLPLNGRVWFPEGPGPFPLVLIVHGNHAMKDFSDPGYEYLGTLLASRDFITVSVDENFLNQKFGGENDVRAFVLLEHLNVWDEWNRTEGHTFEGKVDMGRIALIGHSRGGEAVAHAAAFNRLPRYPDDANPNSPKIGTYHITLSPNIVRELSVDKDTKLIFSIGTENSDQDEPLDLTIELWDGEGNRADLLLSSVGPVHPALTVRFLKWKWLEKKYIEEFSERLLQTYEIPMRQFIENDPTFEPSRLDRIRFVFDRSPRGAIMLDDIGLSL
jgi:hypothetical protein